MAPKWKPIFGIKKIDGEWCCILKKTGKILDKHGTNGLDLARSCTQTANTINKSAFKTKTGMYEKYATKKDLLKKIEAKDLQITELMREKNNLRKKLDYILEDMDETELEEQMAKEGAQ